MVEKLLKRLFIISLLVGVIVLSFVLPIGLSTDIKDIFYRNMGSFETDRLSIVFIGGALLTTIMFFSIYVINLFFYKDKFKVKDQPISGWFITGIAAMYFILIFGFYFIDDIVGIKTINNFNLQDSNKNIIGKVSCYNYYSGSSIVLADEPAICIVGILSEKNKSWFMIQTKIEWTYENNTKSGNETIGQLVLFRAPSNIKYVYLQTNYIDISKNNSFESISVAYPHKFLTIEEYRINKEKFLKYIFALIGIILVTVPLAINESRKLWENQDK